MFRACLLAFLVLVAACGDRSDDGKAMSAVDADHARDNAACRDRVTQAQIAEANPFCLDVLERTAAAGQDTAAYAVAVANAALLFHMRGDYNDAEQFYERAVALQEDLGEIAESDLARTLADRALMDVQRNHPREALPRYERSLALLRASEGNDREERLAGLLGDMGEAYESLGDFHVAAEWYAESVSAYRETLGDAHPNVGIAQNNLASLYQRMEEFDKAEALLKEALARVREALGDEHPVTYMVARNLEDNDRLREDAEARARMRAREAQQQP